MHGHPVLATPDGRALDHIVAGDGPLVISLHGTPQGHVLAPELVAFGAAVEGEQPLRELIGPGARACSRAGRRGRTTPS